MPDAPPVVAMQPGAMLDARLLAEQGKRLKSDPFSVAVREQAKQDFADYFERQDPARVVPCGARMFERARHDARLASPVRHAL